jgi:hypothetical protein
MTAESEKEGLSNAAEATGGDESPTANAERNEEPISPTPVWGEILEPEDLRAQLRDQAEINRTQLSQLRRAKAEQKLNFGAVCGLLLVTVVAVLTGAVAGVDMVIRSVANKPEIIGYTSTTFSLLLVLSALIALGFVYGKAMLAILSKSSEITRLITEQEQALQMAAPFIRENYDSERRAPT